MHIVDIFNFDGAEETLELAAKFLCSARGKDPDAIANTGRPEWMSFLQEVREEYGMHNIFNKCAAQSQVHRRVVYNGHVEDAIEVNDAPAS